MAHFPHRILIVVSLWVNSINNSYKNELYDQFMYKKKQIILKKTYESPKRHNTRSFGPVLLVVTSCRSIYSSITHIIPVDIN